MTAETSSEKIKVAVLEDDRTYRENLVFLLNRSEKVTCVGAFHRAEQALERLATLAPNVVLVDLDLGRDKLSGLDFLPELQRQLPDVRCLILTQFNDGVSIFRALRAGAAGYLDKQEDVLDGMVAEIEEVSRGGVVFSPRVAAKLAGYFRAGSAWDGLSPREREVLDRLAVSLSQKEIATQLGVSEATVKTHCQNIREKLNVSSVHAAVTKIYPRKPGSIDRTNE